MVCTVLPEVLCSSAWLLSVSSLSLVFPFRGYSFVILYYVQSLLDTFSYFSLVLLSRLCPTFP